MVPVKSAGTGLGAAKISKLGRREASLVLESYYHPRQIRIVHGTLFYEMCNQYE